MQVLAPSVWLAETHMLSMLSIAIKGTAGPHEQQPKAGQNQEGRKGPATAGGRPRSQKALSLPAPPDTPSESGKSSCAALPVPQLRRLLGSSVLLHLLVNTTAAGLGTSSEYSFFGLFCG
jgi:hypothetical protein